MKKYVVAIALCYVALIIVLILDVIFRCHGLLGLAFCVVQSGVVLFFAKKLGLAKAEVKSRKEDKGNLIVEDSKDIEGEE